MTVASPPPRTPLRARHNLGSLVRASLGAYASNFIPLIFIALLTLPIPLLVTVILESTDSEAVASASSLLLLASLVVSLVVFGALIAAFHQIASDGKASVGGALDAALGRLLAVVPTALLFLGLLLLSVLAAPVLGIYWLVNRTHTIDGRRDWWLAWIPLALFMYLGVRWGFVLWAVLIENRRGWLALDSSAALVRGHWWRTFGLTLFILPADALPFLLQEARLTIDPFAYTALVGGLAALVTPWTIGYRTALYYDLSTRRQPDDNADPLAAPEPDVHGEGA